MFHFDIYSGKSTNPKPSNYEDFGLGGSVVLNLLRVVVTPANHAIYFDNYFTSFYLFCHLKNNSFNDAGPIQENCIQIHPLEPVKYF